MNDYRDKVFKLSPNRVWRTYTGGRLLDAIEGRPEPADGAFPEDWIGSTVKAVNPFPNSDDAGVSRVRVGGQEHLVADLLAADPVYFLGPRHVAAFGANPRVLVKYLDSAVRLPFQVHPTVAFSRMRLQSDSGKTEAYYILATRPEIEQPYIYIGFQRPPTRDELRRMVLQQDIAGLESCFDRIPVTPGDVFVVPGGAPHALGPGLLLVEILEPTDFVARVEFECAGRVIPEEARFMGRDVEFGLDMFSYEALSIATIQSRWRAAAVALGEDEAPGFLRESLVDQRITDKFRVLRSTVEGRVRWRPLGFTILLVVDGQCSLTIAGETTSLRTYDRVLVPHGVGEVTIESPTAARLLECLPPQTPRPAVSLPAEAGS